MISEHPFWLGLENLHVLLMYFSLYLIRIWIQIFLYSSVKIGSSFLLYNFSNGAWDATKPHSLYLLMSFVPGQAIYRASYILPPSGLLFLYHMRDHIPGLYPHCPESPGPIKQDIILRSRTVLKSEVSLKHMQNFNTILWPKTQTWAKSECQLVPGK